MLVEMQNGSFLCFRSSLFFCLLHFKYKRVSQWQGMTKRLGTKRGVLGDAGRQIEQGIEWL